ncbi:MAG: trimeric intracellular cation channel family protein [Bacteroidota bacterium]
MQSWIYGIDLAGTVVFAISGTLAAGENKLDVFGAAVIAFITAVGGGTLRDVLIGSQPVGWMKDLNYLWMILLGIVLTFLFKKQIRKLGRTMFLFDAIGIGLYTVLGLQKTLGLGLHPIIAMMMGVVSAVFGGVIRDVLTNRVPLIFREEIYATACLAGGGLFICLQHLSLPYVFNLITAILFVIILRILAVRFRWSFPILGG